MNADIVSSYNSMARPPHHHTPTYTYFVIIEIVLFAAASWPCAVVQSAATATPMWCVARSEASQQALQRALDYACGAGADCSPIMSNGLCYLPNTMQAHASYAFNSYYQRKAKAPGSCDFSGTATVAASDPSYGSCVYPSSVSTAGGATTGIPSPLVPTGTSSTPTTITNAPTLPLLTPPLDGVPDSSSEATSHRAFAISVPLCFFFIYLLL